MAAHVPFMVPTIAALLAASSGCVWILDRPPGQSWAVSNDGVKVDGCTDHYGAVVADALLGTMALAGGILGLTIGGYQGSDLDGFTGIGVVGIGGALLHYASAASNDVSRCRALKRQ